MKKIILTIMDGINSLLEMMGKILFLLLPSACFIYKYTNSDLTKKTLFELLVGYLIYFLLYRKYFKSKVPANLNWFTKLQFVLTSVVSSWAISEVIVEVKPHRYDIIPYLLITLGAYLSCFMAMFYTAIKEEEKYKDETWSDYLPRTLSKIVMNGWMIYFFYQYYLLWNSGRYIFISIAVASIFIREVHVGKQIAISDIIYVRISDIVIIIFWLVGLLSLIT